MYRCKYCGNKDIRGIRYLKYADLLPPQEKEDCLIQKFNDSTIIEDSWYCWNCYAKEDDFDDIAEWSDEE